MERAAPAPMSDAYETVADVRVQRVHAVGIRATLQAVLG
jgi:hypothetical protein